ncbi:MAG: MarC family protein [Deltaproteobacteria bacterium]|jgi:multiple antibiotic resistance protein|nr:MarC family protein [Deltaproteobacteria bacterium]MBT6433156.1 MarC family protein [Deltaproteobacteria bacterium]MBT6490881.1 MarC family protein [Deltaproteobacteria bacterium]
MEALAIKSFLTLLVVMDPIALVPMYLGVSGSLGPDDHRQVARRSTMAAGIVLWSFTLIGGKLLATLGISLSAFRIAGGLLLFKIAVDMVFAQRERETEEEQAEAMAKEDISIFPLAIPLMAGPGAMASVMILAGEGALLHPLGSGIVLACTTIVLVLCWAALRLAERIAKVLGTTGINVVTRILGVLLAALAVQYVADGTLAFLA